MDQADDRVNEDADVLDSDAGIPLLGLGLGGTEPAEEAAPLGPEPASLLPGVLPGELEPVEEVALLDPSGTRNHCQKRQPSFCCSGRGQGLWNALVCSGNNRRKEAWQCVDAEPIPRLFSETTCVSGLRCPAKSRKSRRANFPFVLRRSSRQPAKVPGC